MIKTNNEETKKPDFNPLTVSEKAMIYLVDLQKNDIHSEDPIEKKAKVKAVITTL